VFRTAIEIEIEGQGQGRVNKEAAPGQNEATEPAKHNATANKELLVPFILLTIIYFR